jgi:peptidoglycan/LPS O-acetylase OafA/YrhL
MATDTVKLYQPDIDGLRAVAVLSAFLYHLNIPGFGGGYVGVDVFFVISGFLITRILLTEYRTTGRIDFRAFSLRRIRRAIPALIAVLVLTTPTSIIFLSPTQHIAYGQSLIATVASVSNIWFGANSGYFDGDATQKQLLHTWSLGVKEQFYLIWPVCIALLARVTQVRSWHFGVIVVGATLLSEYWLGFDPTTTFFGMPFRGGEFAIGALVFVLQPFVLRICWLAPLLWSTMRSMKNATMLRFCANSTPLQAMCYARYAAGELAHYLYFLHQNGIQRVIEFGDFVSLSRDLSDIVSSNGFSASAVEQSQIATAPLDIALRDVTMRYGCFLLANTKFLPQCTMYVDRREPSPVYV